MCIIITGWWVSMLCYYSAALFQQRCCIGCSQSPEGLSSCRGKIGRRLWVPAKPHIKSLVTLWPWGYLYRWLPLLGFRELVPAAAIPADLSHTVVTSHSAGHAAVPPPGVSPVAVVLLVMLQIYNVIGRLVPLNRAPHLSVWQLGLSCTLFPDRWIAGGCASFWPAPRGSKTMTPTHMWWAMGQKQHISLWRSMASLSGLGLLWGRPQLSIIRNWPWSKLVPVAKH